MQNVKKDKTAALEKIESALGYTFKDVDLLARALTHRSFANESRSVLIDNERLEFLGDAVLDLVVSEHLMQVLDGQDEGVLTQTRSEVVSMPSLAKLSRSLDLGSGLFLGKGEERSGGRDKSNLLADALEAVIGAVFTDGGYEAARGVVLALFDTLLKSAIADEDTDYKSRLQEFLQGQQRALPVYQLVDSSGPDHERCYSVQVFLDGQAHGSGEGRSKKMAEQDAARVTLKQLENK